MSRSRTALAFLAVAIVCAPGAARAGEGTPPASPAPAGAEAQETKPWPERLAEAAQRIEVARERLEKAEARYSRARHDDHPRGEALAAIEREYRDAQRELAAAEAALPELVEQARRDGVEPGVLRPYW